MEKKEEKHLSSGKKNTIKILLITNRDSDNVGDQIIEACDISLIHAVMNNLGYQKKDYKINSRAAGIVSKQYLMTKDEALYKKASAKIKDSDILIFGGAPLFNYAYQSFYKRTIITLQLAEKHSVPVLFSSIGIEKYDEYNEKCQRLKAAVNLPCVKQITTRDDFHSLKQYKEKEELSIAKVADPAVFADKVFEKHRASKKTRGLIGLVVVRHGIFEDNGIVFSENEQIKLWTDIVNKLTESGYDYEFITTGHFSDEVFLDVLCRENRLLSKKCVFNINTPEDLTKRVSSYNGLIAFRLHASITAYAFSVPSIGLNWNPKVPGFYQAIGYPERAFGSKDWNAEQIVTALEKAINQGVQKDNDYIISVYNTLFSSMKELLRSNQDTKPYPHDQLLKTLSAYEGTTEIEKERKLKRKFRRTYMNYHQLETVKLAYDKLIEQGIRKKIMKKLKGSLSPKTRSKLRDIYNTFPWAKGSND